ncbi:3'-5' exonuclease [Escherichia coli]|uniref:3'-5' exonuclease n=1 Tax=Escherichia coli TaxID=562 RepID=UPI0028E09F6F|nr:3'-5' exonuclease [Escherichia coli]
MLFTSFSGSLVSRISGAVHYYNDRDVRTIVELGKTIDFDARTVIPFEGVRHNALDDARHQAKYVTATIQKLIPSQADF